MAASLGQFARNFLFLVGLCLIGAASASGPSMASPPYAAYVMDARTGETLYSENADTRLHPASLTKMMTLYITFQEIEAGHLSLDTMITVSKNAASMPPSRLGLKAGQKVALRYLVRAAAVKSANDAAAAIGDAIAGSPAKFGERMTRTAKSLGMKNTTFKNANGLTAKGHLSTAHDMSILGRHLFYDFPDYYNIFSRRSTDAGITDVNNTNRKFLDAYEGADGIKTGYTDAAGFNLTASAQRDGVRIIATVFGGTSTADRNAKMADLLDLGFRKAPPGVQTIKPAVPGAQSDDLVASNVDTALPEVANGAGKTVRVMMAVAASPRPQTRPGKSNATDVAVAAMADDIAGALAEATAPPPDTAQAQAADMTGAEATVVAALDSTADAAVDGVTALSGIAVDPANPENDAETVAALVVEPELVIRAAPAIEPVQLVAMTRPVKRNLPNYDAQGADAFAAPEQEVVTRVSTSGGSRFGVNLGHYNTRSGAERALINFQLEESATLKDGLRKVLEMNGGYDATILGLTQDEADLACRRFQARAEQCFTMAP